jgi:hypothetical protein
MTITMLGIDLGSPRHNLSEDSTSDVNFVISAIVLFFMLICIILGI